MSVLITKVQTEEICLPMSDKVIKRLVIYKDDGSVAYLNIADHLTKEKFAAELRNLATVLEKK